MRPNEKKEIDKCTIYINDVKAKHLRNKMKTNGEPLLSREEVADILRLSLVIRTDWMKRGLPFS
jgi:hypothetical protein